MDTWLHAIHADGGQRFRWFVLNRYGELIVMSVKTFESEDEAKLDLEAHLTLMGRSAA